MAGLVPAIPAGAAHDIDRDPRDEPGDDGII